MKLWIAVALGAVITGVVAHRVRRFRQERAHTMPTDWLHEQDREHLRTSAQIDGVSWRWPVNKVKDEHGAFNAHRLRKRESA